MLANIVVRVFTTLIMTVIWLIYLEQFLAERYSRKKTLCLFAVFTVVFSLCGFTELRPGSELFRFCSLFVLVALLILVSFRGPFFRQFLVYVGLLLLISLAEGSSILVISALGKGFSLEEISTPLFVAISCMDLLIQGIAVVCITLFVKRHLFRLNAKSLLQFTLYPLSQVVMLDCTLWVMANDKSNLIAWGLLIFIVVALLADVALLHAIRDMGQKRELELQNEYLLEQEKLQMRHYVTLQEQYADIRTLRHDIVGHLHTVQILTERGEMEGAKQYARDLLDTYEQIRAVSYCENKIADAILTDKLRRAEQSGIAVEAGVTIPDGIPIADIDLVCVFSNLLDNAMEACTEVEPPDARRLSIRAAPRLGNLVISVENTYQNEAEQPKNRPGRMKHYSLGHEIIRSIADRYGGAITVEAGETHYLVQVSLPLERRI